MNFREATSSPHGIPSRHPCTNESKSRAALIEIKHMWCNKLAAPFTLTITHSHQPPPAPQDRSSRLPTSNMADSAPQCQYLQTRFLFQPGTLFPGCPLPFPITNSSIFPLISRLLDPFYSSSSIRAQGKTVSP
jgi:hypothetical protein